MKALTLARSAAAVLALGSAASALAQSTPDEAANRAEARLDRRPDREPGGIFALDGQAEKPWSLSFGSPFRYASNPANDETGAIGAGYVDPSISLGRDWDLGGATTLSFEAGADMQAFTNHSGNDLSTYYGNLRLTFGSGTIKPYVDYTIISLYDGQFESHAVTLHQFTIGAKAKVMLGEADTLAIDANVMRREASALTTEQVRFGLGFKLKHAFAETDRLVLSARGRYADYTGGTASTRTDKNLLMAAVFEHDLSASASVDLGVTFERNWSNKVGKSYSAFEVGPSITLTASF